MKMSVSVQSMTTNNMSLSEAGIKFITGFETPNGEPYLKAVKSPETNKDGSLKYEIGWGHNSDSFFRVTKDSIITKQEALDIFKHDVSEVEEALNQWIKEFNLSFVQHEFDALCSALYNGIPITNSQYGISRAIANHLGSITIANEWRKWVYMTVNGKKVKANGLIKRREKELNLYFSGEYD